MRLSPDLAPRPTRPHPAPPGGKVRVVTAAEGSTVAAIVAQVLPSATEADLLQVRVVLVGRDGEMPIERRHWTRVRPKRGVRVAVRVVPAKRFLSTILQILVLVVAVALAVVLGPMLATAWGISLATAQSLIMAGVSAIGMLAISAFIKPPGPEGREKARFLVTGLANRPAPNAPVPVLYGRMRVYPVLAAPPYTEVVGDQQYVRVLSIVSTGPVTFEDWKIGDTAISEFGDDITMEVRTGLPGDGPHLLYPTQVLEETVSADLTAEVPEDDFGTPIKGQPVVPKRVVRTSSYDATRLSVILAFPSGLVDWNKEGKRRSKTRTVRIEARAVGETAWTTITEIAVARKTQQPFLVQHSWDVARGAYDVGVTTLEQTNGERTASDRCVWAALQSFRPEAPLVSPIPLATVALRLKATAQVQGQLEALNCVATRVAPDWDAATGTWVTRATRSPAAALRSAFQAAYVRRRKTDAQLDLDGFAEWSEWCEAKGLHYDRYVAEEVSARALRDEIAAAGRARSRWDGVVHRVAIDRPAAVVDHIGPLNVRAIEWERAYVNFPDAFRVQFQDASDSFKQRERLIPWPGHSGDIVLTEALDMPGKTDAGEIWREARRRQHELRLRPDQFRAIQDGHLRVAELGDRVALTAPTVEAVLDGGRVRRVAGRRVEFDRPVKLPAAPAGIRWIRATEDDPVGKSQVNRIVETGGERGAVTLAMTSPLPVAGDIVAIGPEGAEHMECLVRGIEMGDAGAQILHLVAAAPEIDALVDADVPPTWTGRVGSSIGPVTTVPGVPRIVSADTATDGTLTLVMVPGASSAVVGRYELRHRASGAPAWTTVVVSAAEGSVRLTGYASGAGVEIQIRAVSIYEFPSDWSDVASYTIGEDVDPVPPVIGLAVERLAEAWTISWAYERLSGVTYADVATVEIRARSGTWAAWDDLATVATGSLTSPWLTTEPLSDGGLYTFAVAAFDADDRRGTAALVTVSGTAVTVEVIGLDDGEVLADDDGAWISGD